MNGTDIKDLPLDFVGTGNPTRNSNLSYCYIRLRPSTAALDTSPRPDLLWQWQPHLLQALQGWDMAWASQKQWKDKSFWVHLSSPHHIDEADHTRFHEAVNKTCKHTSYNITSSFMMKPASVGVVMTTVNDAKRLIEASSIALLDCDPPFTLSTALVIHPQCLYDRNMINTNTTDKSI
jgi:hypothetical protein